MKKIALVFLTVFLVSCAVPEQKVCSVDQDCRGVTCCHAKDAVNVQNEPNCDGVLCTMECVPDTLDCGQGEIKCVSGACKAIFNK